MNLILFGPPGAGKGTQTDMLSKHFNLYKVATGNLLRNEILKKSLLGKKIKSIVDRGSLVSDSIMNNLIENLLSQKKLFNRLIFDGYPRTLNQTENLENSFKKFNQKILCVLSLKVDKKIIIKRIMGRQICSKCGLIFNEYFNSASKRDHKCGVNFLQKRSDDNQSTIETRYETYLKQTAPIVDYYKDKNLLYEINGVGEISNIYAEIKAIISGLKG